MNPHSSANNCAMKVLRHARYADRVMRVEGALAVAGVGSGVLLWSQARYSAATASPPPRSWDWPASRPASAPCGTTTAGGAGRRARRPPWPPCGRCRSSCTCVANFVVPGTRQGDTDVLVLGPFGVLVVEVKAYAGHYGCHGDAWHCVRPDGTRQPLRSSVSRQVKRGRKDVQHYLVDCDISAPVHAVAVVPPATPLDLVHPTVPIVRTDQLADYIAQLPAATRPAVCAADLEPLFAPPPPPFRRQPLGRLSFR